MPNSIIVSGKLSQILYGFKTVISLKHMFVLIQYMYFYCILVQAQDYSGQWNSRHILTLCPQQGGKYERIFEEIHDNT